MSMKEFIQSSQNYNLIISSIPRFINVSVCSYYFLGGLFVHKTQTQSHSWIQLPVHSTETFKIGTKPTKIDVLCKNTFCLFLK